MVLSGASGGTSVVGSGTGGDPYIVDSVIDPNPNNILTSGIFGLLVDGTIIGGSALRSYTLIAASSALVGADDFVLIDTSGGPVDVSLDPAPVNGKTVTVKWIAGASLARVLGNGNLIDFGAAPLAYGTLQESFDLSYYSASGTWLIN